VNAAVSRSLTPQARAAACRALNAALAGVVVTSVRDWQRQAIAEIDAVAAIEIDELDDNAVKELVDLARANDEAGFRALASCVVAPGQVDDLWTGTRARLGLV
jgi:hypothetical protein